METLVVLGIIALILALMRPALAQARERSEYVEWQAYSHSLRGDQDLIAYYNFEHDTHGDRLLNAAVGDAMDGRYGSDQFDGEIDSPNWTEQGRWPGKPALSFVPSQYSRGVRVEPKTGSTHTDTITVMGWVRYFGPPTHSDIIADKWVTSGNQRSWQLYFQSGELRWSVSNNGKNSGRVKIRTDVSDMYGQWMHFAATFDGEKTRLYVNGGLRGRKSQTGIHRSNLPIHIGGGGRSGASGKINAIIDELAIYRKALSVDQIREHYLVGEPHEYVSPRGFRD